MTNLSGANLNNGAAVGPQGEGRDSPSRFPKYPVYKDSGVEWLGTVPAHWVLTPIKHLALLNPRKSDFAGDTEQLCSFVPMEKLKTGVVQLDEERPIEEVIGYTYFEDGDVLQAKVTPCFENKNIAIAKGLTNGIGFGSSEINVLRPYQGVNAEYLYYRVQEDSYMSFCTSSMIGAGGLKRVPTDVINNFKIAAPTLCEQTQIARFLDHETARIDALIEEQQRLIELLKEKRQAVISHAVTKGLDPTAPMKDSGVEWLGEVPAHWEVTKLGWILIELTYGFTNPMPTEDDGPAMLTANDIGWGTVLYEQARSTSEVAFREMLTDKSRPKAGDLLLTKDGTLGRVAVHDGRPACINQSVALIRPDTRIMSSEFLCSLLQASCYQTKMIFDAGGTTIKHIYITILAKMNLAVPSLDEQQSLLNFIRSETCKFDRLTSEAEQVVNLLQERRSALISAAVTGKIDVRGWQPPVSTQAPESAVAEAN